MATLLLTAAGAALGGSLGTAGLVIGQAAGALAGGLIDRWLFGAGPREAGRLADLDVQASTEGAPIPRVFGRARIAGQVIWATRFEEEANSSGGGKGLGPRVRTYDYFANVAIGLCEGPIAHVGRVWANGELLDTTRVVMRVHKGGEGQEPDSLITAKQGEGTVPAYRGLAYVVFERLPLADFGNALPQFSFEVIRPVGRVEQMIRAVTLIPGATEYGYATEEVQRRPRRGVSETENRHAPQAGADVIAALDELQAVCPQLESVALVVSWFGDDLRAGLCKIRPKVEYSVKPTTEPWIVSGLQRGDADEVSRVAGKVAYGGTPTDDSVIALIRELKARGLKVTFYPFVMMDVPPGNSRADPYGGTGQPAFPWRGRITCHPAPGRSGSPDGTAAAATQIVSLVGTAAPGDFDAGGGAVGYSGPGEWTLRRMILHYAHLCEVAGGVDTFLIGSEFRGLTWVRREGSRYPFVEALTQLLEDVRTVLRPSTLISYAADWSEFFGHQPADGSGDITFHLDPLWAHPDCDFVGIDAYFPLSDWRDGDHADRGSASGPRDLDYLRAGIAGGELFDWYYASDADRRAGTRSPITDGAAGKPWVFRPKDLVNWWGNRHFNRPGGVEAASPTAWLAGMKPLRFTEFGCPAVDLGANQPNVFPDRLSAEGASPHFSHGTRDDAMQRRYLEAMLGWFDPADADYVSGSNPLSPIDGRRMLEVDRSHVWTFDARPWPWFPLADDVWSDGANWATGHWVNGRLGAAPLAGVIDELAGAAGMGSVDVRDLSAVVDGLVIAERTEPRRVIEALGAVFRFTATETATGIRIADADHRPVIALASTDLVDDGRRPLIERRRAEEEALPTEVTIGFLDSEAEGRRSAVTARRDGVRRAVAHDLPASGNEAVMRGLAEGLLRDLEANRERLSFALPPTAVAIEPGDVIALDSGGQAVTLAVERIEDGPDRRIEGRIVDPFVEVRAYPGGFLTGRLPPRLQVTGRPHSVILDLPATGDGATAHRPKVAATASPWPGTITVARHDGATFTDAGTIESAATMGVLATPLAPGPVHRFDRRASFEVELDSGALAAVSDIALLGGANLAAVGTEAGGFEVIQFALAELVGERRYRLSRLLRGQGGTELLSAAGHAAGADFVLLDGRLGTLELDTGAVGAEQQLRIGPATRDIGDPSMDERQVTPGGVGLRPLSPVHLKVRRLVGGDLAIGWIRRSRIGADDFQAVEIPLGEASEAYRLTIRDGATIRRTVETAASSFLYTLGQQLADFGAAPSVLDLEVAQLSATVGAGTPLRSLLDV